MTLIRLSVCWFDPLRVFLSTLLAARCSQPGPAGTKLGQTARRSQTVYAMCPSVCSKQTPPLHGVNYKEKRLLQMSARGQNNEGLNFPDMTRLTISFVTQNADEAIRGIKIEMMSYFSPRGLPQNLGFSREQLGRFKHPATRKSKRKFNCVLLRASISKDRSCLARILRV